MTIEEITDWFKRVSVAVDTHPADIEVSSVYGAIIIEVQQEKYILSHAVKKESKMKEVES